MRQRGRSLYAARLLNTDPQRRMRGSALCRGIDVLNNQLQIDAALESPRPHGLPGQSGVRTASHVQSNLAGRPRNLLGTPLMLLLQLEPERLKFHKSPQTCCVETPSLVERTVGVLEGQRCARALRASRCG